MKAGERSEKAADRNALVLTAFGWGLFLTLIVVVASRQYGFHRDELAMLDNAHHLAWGFVEYPPLVPFLARLDLALFGLSVAGLRTFPILATCLVLLLTGLMARAIGGSRRAQIVAGLAAVTAPVLLFDGLFLSYATFDYLWWVVVAYLMVRLLKSGDPRWWLGIGAVIGLGGMTKYSMAFFVVGIAAGVLFTPARCYLKSPWLWVGAALAIIIVLPNLIWQAHHEWLTLRFTASIHARDIRIGRTGLLSFLAGQFYANTNIGAIGLWISGFWYSARRPEGHMLRPLAWMAAVPFGLFLVLQGRFYYPAPVYPMLIAAGTCWMEQKWKAMPGKSSLRQQRWLYGCLAVSGALVIALTLPLAPVHSAWWRVSDAANSELREEIGWPELVSTIAQIRSSLPVSEQAGLGILAGNYGEAGAINLYGPAYGLPTAISGSNSYALRGYGDPPPQTLIVVGLSQANVFRLFQSCQLAGHTSNRYGIMNEETRDHPDIFICRDLRQPWPLFWENFQYFG